MTLPEWMMSEKFMERILDSQLRHLPEIWSRKLQVLEPKDKVVFKRMHKSVFDRVIDLQTFYSIVTGNQPRELHVGYREIGEIKKESIDIPVYSDPTGNKGGMLGTLIGMPVFQENKSHHMEIK